MNDGVLRKGKTPALYTRALTQLSPRARGSATALSFKLYSEWNTNFLAHCYDQAMSRYRPYPLTLPHHFSQSYFVRGWRCKHVLHLPRPCFTSSCTNHGTRRYAQSRSQARRIHLQGIRQSTDTNEHCNSWPDNRIAILP